MIDAIAVHAIRKVIAALERARRKGGCDDTEIDDAIADLVLLVGHPDSAAPQGVIKAK
jgi:hypothetical protein